MNKKRLVIIFAIFVVALAVAFFFFEKGITGNSIDLKAAQANANSQNANTNSGTNSNYSPLSQDEINKVGQAILSSEFIKNIPEKDPISISFYKFEGNQRIWQGGFLIGNGKLLQSGDPGISIIMHSKYIAQLNGNNLCDIIKQANKNRDLGFSSKYSTVTLLMKYSGLLKYRDCFGF